MQNESEVVSHIFKRTSLFQKDNSSFVFKGEINLRASEKSRKTNLEFETYKFS